MPRYINIVTGAGAAALAACGRKPGGGALKGTCWQQLQEIFKFAGGTGTGGFGLARAASRSQRAIIPSGPAAAEAEGRCNETDWSVWRSSQDSFTWAVDDEPNTNTNADGPAAAEAGHLSLGNVRSSQSSNSVRSSQSSNQDSSVSEGWSRVVEILFEDWDRPAAATSVGPATAEAEGALDIMD